MAEGAGWDHVSHGATDPTRLAALGDPGSSPGQALPLSGGGGASGFASHPKYQLRGEPPHAGSGGDRRRSRPARSARACPVPPTLTARSTTTYPLGIAAP